MSDNSRKSCFSAVVKPPPRFALSCGDINALQRSLWRRCLSPRKKLNKIKADKSKKKWRKRKEKKCSDTVRWNICTSVLSQSYRPVCAPWQVAGSSLFLESVFFFYFNTQHRQKTNGNSKKQTNKINQTLLSVAHVIHTHSAHTNKLETAERWNPAQTIRRTICLVFHHSPMCHK